MSPRAELIAFLSWPPAFAGPSAGGKGGLFPDGRQRVHELVAVAILAAGVARPRATRVAVAAVTVIYVLATLSELVNGTVLLGAVPVDMRDRIVHPLIALLGAIALMIARRRRSSSVVQATGT